MKMEWRKGYRGGPFHCVPAGSMHTMTKARCGTRMRPEGFALTDVRFGRTCPYCLSGVPDALSKHRANVIKERFAKEAVA